MLSIDTINENIAQSSLPSLQEIAKLSKMSIMILN